MQADLRVVCDVECLPNYFMVGFRNLARTKTVNFERYEDEDGNVIINFDTKALQAVMSKRETITFNGRNYDEIIISLAIQGHSCAYLKEVSDSIIGGKMKRWDVEEAYDVRIQNFNSIDLIEVAKGKAGLKMYAARIHSQEIRELPTDHAAFVTPQDRVNILDYNGVDLDDTIDIYNFLLPQIRLREVMSKEYDIDLRSKSDAQIAEAVIKKELQKLTGKKYYKPTFDQKKTFKFKSPDFIKFKSKNLQEMLSNIQTCAFTVGEGGKPIMHPDLADEDGNFYIDVCGTQYKMGMGGLHSCEKSKSHRATQFVKLYDRDVRSYYPTIIINQKLFPSQLGREFLKIIAGFIARRLHAKDIGDKVISECLKIVLNGSFGKFGSKWSILYSPELLIQTTLTGQLSLLMLIETLNLNGIPVVSANTDGVVIKCHVDKRKRMLDIVKAWEIAGNYETEEVEYSALYSRDVNSYIAIKTNGEVKTKGPYAGLAIDKNPTNQICVNAVVKKITEGIPISQTIMDGMDVRDFLTARTVAGGAHKDGEYVGKVVRWYNSTDTNTTINYIDKNKKVGKSQGGMPLMVLPKDNAIPDDLDWNHYINQSYSMLRDVAFLTPHPDRPSKRRDKKLQALFDEVIG